MTYDPFFGDREPPAAAQRRSDAAWAQVREDYLGGASAPQLAARYGVSVSALRTRARAEGWRRVDAPDPSPEPEADAEALADAASATPAELRATAWARTVVAVRRGRLAEAQGWTRLVRQLDAMVIREAASPALQARAADTLARAKATLEALRRDVARTPAAASPELHELHELPIPSCAAGAGKGDQAQPGRRDYPQATPGADLAPSVGRPAATSPAPAAQLRNGAPQLHDLHDDGEAAVPPSPPPRARGPAVPPVPPGWVRHALHAPR